MGGVGLAPLPSLISALFTPGIPQLPPGGAEPKTKGVELALKGVEPALQGAELPPSFPPLLGQLAEAFEEHLTCKYPGGGAGGANTP